MEVLWKQFLEVVGERLPVLMGALGILVVGWLGAFILAAVIRGIFNKAGLNKLVLKGITGQDKPRDIEPGSVVATAAFYVSILFVLVAFFQALGLTNVTNPLNNILNQIAGFAPRLISAGLLLLVAWVAARILKTLIFKILTKTNADERLLASTGLKKKQDWSIAESVADASYWVVFLFFLPVILQALALEGLLGPVENMLTKILDFLPNIVSAGFLLLIGWFLARISQQIASNLLSAAGFNKVGERAGLAKILGSHTLSDAVGLVVYVFILIPTLIAALDALQVAAISSPATRMLSTFFNAVPSIVTAALVLGVAYVVGRFVAQLVTRLLSGMGFDNIFVKLGLGLKPVKGERTPSEIVGYLALIAIVLFASIEAANALNFTSLGSLLLEFTTFAGQVVLGLIIFGVGLYFARVASNIIRERGGSQAKVLDVAAQASIATLAAAMALRQMGLANELITVAFGLVLGSIVIAAALAFGLAVGLGSREIAAREVEKWLRNFKGS